MAMIYMVRHGEAAAGFGSHADPGLSDAGRAQARATAARLNPLGPIAVYSSPLARARETALPLTELWEVEPIIEPRVAEIPSPTDDLAERAAWLRGVMADRWSHLGADLVAWRQAMIDCVTAYEHDCVVFCHFIAINVIVGAATGADQMITFRPDNGSVTILETEGSDIRLIELGRQADTKVN